MFRFLRQNLATIVVNLVTFLVLALGLELCVKWMLNNPQKIPASLLPLFKEYYRTEDRSIIQVTDCAHYDPELFYMLKPGSCTYSNREFETQYSVNSAGLRDDEDSLNEPEIICLGDSYTMGWGVQQDEAFPQILEKSTGRKVLNAGVSSFGTAREVMLLKRLSTDKLHTIILQVHANDFEENETFLKNNFYLPVRSQAQYDSLRNQIEKRKRYFPFKHLYGILKQVQRKGANGNASEIKPRAAAQDFFAILKQAGIKPGIRIIIFYIEDRQNLSDEFILATDSLIKNASIDNIQISTIKLASDMEDSDYFTLDEHLNATGHIKIASKIQDLFFNE